MRRLILGLCACALLAVPAMAMAGLFASDGEYQGRLKGDPQSGPGDPNTYIGFDVTGRRHHHMVRHVKIAAPMACYNGDQRIVEVQATDPIEVRDTRGSGYWGEFSDGLEAVTDVGPGTAHVGGYLSRHGQAQGPVRVRTHSPTFGRCYSGDLWWSAKKGANVDYPPAR
jgi:hypothetical protein